MDHITIYIITQTYKLHHSRHCSIHRETHLPRRYEAIGFTTEMVGQGGTTSMWTDLWVSCNMSKHKIMLAFLGLCFFVLLV